MLGNKGCLYSFCCENQQPCFKGISRWMSAVAGLLKKCYAFLKTLSQKKSSFETCISNHFDVLEEEKTFLFFLFPL